MRSRTLISIGGVLLLFCILDRLYPLSPSAVVGDTLGIAASLLVVALGLWQRYREKK